MAEATAMRNNALPYPVYGAPWTIVVPLLDADGDPVTGASTPDSEVSKNGDTFADCTNEMTEIATGSGIYYLTLTGTEMTADIVAVQFKSATAGMKTTVAVLYPRKLVSLRADTAAGGAAGSITLDASANATDDFYNGCLVVGVLDSATEARIITDYVGSTKVATVTPNWNTTPDSDDTFTIYLPEGRQVNQADTTHIASALVSTAAAQLGVNVVNAAGTAWGSGAITAASIATNAIDADALAADAIAEINATVDAAISDAALATAAALATVDTVVDAILVDTAEIGAAGAGLTAVPWNAAWDAEVQSEVTDALNAYDPPTKAELDAAVANVSVDEIQASALADLFNTDSGTTYASAVAGSVVAEIADNAGGSSLTAADIADAVWDEATTGHTTSGTFGEQLKTDVDAIQAKTDNLPSDPADASVVAGLIAGVDAKIDTIDNFLDTEVAAILADTNELQTDWADGGRLDLILDGRASQASVDTVDDFLDTEIAAIKAKTDNLPSDPADASVIAGRFDTLDTAIADLPTNAELSTALAAADDAVLAAIAALENLSAAEVNAEVVDALNTDTYAEPGQGAPGATITLSAKIGYLYKAWRNRTTQTASEYALYADDAVTKDHEAAVADDGTTFSRAEVTTGA